MENASAAFLDAVRKSIPAIGIAMGAPPTIDPGQLTCTERLQLDAASDAKLDRRQSYSLRST